MNPEIVSVSQFVAIMNETLAFAYPSVTVEGEVASFKLNQGKWVFFDLKDEESTLSCFMPVFQLKVPLEDGMKVRVSGGPKLTKWGKFSFTVKSVELAGEGELMRAFELLKERLGKEGLFDESRKRELPKFPRSIGLITSIKSAAYADFVKILGTRFGGIGLQVADVQVQGAAAPDQICGALSYFNQLSPQPDVLVMIRGGGSLEDLQAFNTEAVARAVAASRTPIIVGVGHEIDFSLADLAADRRAATPTDAARIVVPDRGEIQQLVEHHTRQMGSSLARHFVQADHDMQRFLQVVHNFMRIPADRVERQQATIKAGIDRLNQRHGERFEGLSRVLRSFDPGANLRRGYAIVRRGDHVLKSVKAVGANDKLVIQLADGQLKSRVEDESV